MSFSGRQGARRVVVASEEGEWGGGCLSGKKRESERAGVRML